MTNCDNASSLAIRGWPRKVECNVQSFRNSSCTGAMGAFVCHGISHTHEGTFATLEDRRGQIKVVPLDVVHQFQIIDDAANKQGGERE